MPSLFRPLANPTLPIVAFTYAVMLEIGVLAGFFGIAVAMMVLLSTGRYAYEVLREVARGRREPPPPGIESMNPFGGNFTVVLHFTLFMLLFFFLATTPLIDPLWRFVLSVAELAVLPASAAVMSLTNNVFAAMNPASIVHVMGVLREHYAKLLGACVVLSLFTALLETVAASFGIFASILGLAVLMWGVFALFALIGGVIRARRDEFAFPGYEEEDERAARLKDADRQKTLDRAFASIRSGMAAQGYKTIKELLASEQGSLEIYQFVFNRMLTWEQPEHALELGQRFVARLIAEKRQHQALELAEQCRRLSKTFVLAPDSRTALIAYARTIGRHRVADEIEAATQS